MRTEVRLGKLIEDVDANRDAIHIAVCPMKAASKLYPGQDVGLWGASLCEAGETAEPIGVVDPFLKKPVQPGQAFWLLLYPGSITSLRHDWAHPAFSAIPKHSDAEAYLLEIAEMKGLSLDALLGHAKDYVDDDEYYIVHGHDEHGEGVDWPRFWRCYREHTGRDVPKDAENDYGFFSCSC